MFLETRRTARGVELHLTGAWRVTHLDALSGELAGVTLTDVNHVLIDTTALSALDLSASVKLRDFLQRAGAAGASVEFTPAAPDQLRLIETTMGEPAAADPGVPGPDYFEEPVEALGRRVVGGWGDLVSGLAFGGRIAVTALGGLRVPD